MRTRERDNMEHSESELETERRDERHERRRELREMRESGILGENTPIRIGLLLTIALLLVGGFGTSIWWAATISTKLDAIIISQGVESATIAAAQADVADLKAWRKVIDVAGTPATSSRLDGLTAKVNSIDEMLKLHIAKEDKTK